MSEDRITVGRAEYLGGGQQSRTILPRPPSGEPAVQQPPLLRAELVDARARAFELAMLRSRPAPGICWPSYAEIEAVANEILAYILNGKQP